MKRKRYSREDWLDLAQRELAQHGADALRLEAICDAAGMTRGSFYHHFESHPEFLLALVAHWRVRDTDRIASEVATIPDAETAMAQLTDLALKIDFRFELGLRELARRRPDIAAAIAKVDETRVGFLAGLYERFFGIEPAKARLAAHCEYAAYCGIILLDPDIAEADQRALADFYYDMVQAHFARA